jgi:hypothetical protein
MPSEKKPDNDREEQIARLVRAYERRLREKYPPSAQTIDEMERTAQEIGEGVKQDIQQEQSDALGAGYQGKKITCACEGVARFKGQRERRIVTLHGDLLLNRAYYWCSRCRSGFCPLDATLRVPRGQVSVSVRALACRFSALLPYGKAARELELVCGVHLSNSTLQRISRQTGNELANEWRKRQEAVWAGSFEPTIKAPKQMHVSMDGVMAHVGGIWREVKLGVSFVRGKKGPICDRYCASLLPSHEFGKALKTMSVFAGETLCRMVAVLADGSDWIWQESAKHFTTHTQILDFFHVTEHLWAVARTRFGHDKKAASDWIAIQKDRLLEREYGAAEVIRDITDWQPDTDCGRDVRRTNLAYLINHQHRMKYKSFRSQGYHIGSGVMESSCRWVVQQRMKGSGMRWQTEGAEAMLHLRTAYCSNADADILSAARRSTAVA